MPDETLFISDLHLEASRPQTTQLFVHLLNGRAARCESLYILGDLFELWVGDDHDTELHRTVTTTLRKVADGGTRVYLLVGNRDFLIGDRFAEAAGCELLPDEKVVDLYGTPTLVSHGDLLCTDDAEYQQFRRQVRDEAWQRQFLSLPLEQRLMMAKGIREKSMERGKNTAQEIMDANDGAVRETLRRHGVSRMIHGHTHRPAVHRVALEGRDAERIVLGDWQETARIASCDANGCRLETYGPL